MTDDDEVGEALHMYQEDAPDVGFDIGLMSRCLRTRAALEAPSFY